MEYRNVKDIEPASLETVLEFCNDIRNWGGGNPLDALLPAVPGHSESCLIARNLNFSCAVEPIEVHRDPENWIMTTDYEVVRNVLDKNNGKWDIEENSDTSFLIPPDIAAVAIEFDRWLISSIEDDGVPDNNLSEYITDDYWEGLLEESLV